MVVFFKYKHSIEIDLNGFDFVNYPGKKTIHKTRGQLIRVFQFIASAAVDKYNS